MNAPMAGISPKIEPNCAICNAPPLPECHHENERLKLALDQAMGRWDHLAIIRQWAVDHSKNSVISTFNVLRDMRYHTMREFLQTIPCYALYVKYAGHPPIPPQQLADVTYHISSAYEVFKAGVNEDWRRCCLDYPKILDYYLSLIEVGFPADHDPAMKSPVYATNGAPPVKVQHRVKGRRDSGTTDHRKKERRRSRGRTPPAPPVAPHHRRG